MQKCMLMHDPISYVFIDKTNLGYYTQAAT
jgi:hypothetical protein